MGSGSPPSSINVPTGAPYSLTGQASSTTGQWISLTVTFKDLTSWTFTPSSGNANFYLLTKISNIANHAINIGYDPATNRLSSITDDASPANTLLSFVYSGGYLSTVTDTPGSRTITYASNTVGSATELHTVSQINTTSSYAWQYDYTAVNGWPLLTQAGVQDPTGNSSNITEYPASGYDTSGRITALKDANSNQRLYTYNSGNTQVQVKRQDGTLDLSFTRNFDSSKRNTGFTDANGHTETFGYTDSNNPKQPTSDTNRNSQQATFTYDQFANTLTVTVPCDGSTLTTTYTYDYNISSLGLLTSVQEGSKTPTKYAYYPLGSTPSTNGGYPGQLETLYLPTPGTSGANTWVQENYYYTLKGNIDHITSPAPNSASGVVTTQYYYTYDPEYPGITPSEALGQPLAIHIIDQNNTTVSDIHYRYDSAGNRTALIDAMGNETDYQYNANRQLTSIIFPKTGQTGSYNAHTDFTYLHSGGLLQSINYFDESGNLNPVNSETVGLGSEAESKNQGGMAETVSLGYDSDYRPKTMTDGNNNTEWTIDYDPIGDMNSLTYPNGDSLGWGFDNDGNLNGRTDGLTRNTTYSLATDDSRLTGITYGDNGTTPGVSYQYDAYDRVTQMTDGSGTTAYTYDDLDNILSVTTTYTGLPASTVSYTYNTDGTRASMTIPTMANGQHTYTYQYDALGNITNVFCPWTGGADTYTYLTNANNRTNGWLLKQHTARVDTNYTYNARGFLTELQNVNTISSAVISDYKTLQYDALGNCTQVTVNTPQVGSARNLSGTITYLYDGHNRLTEEKRYLSNYPTGYIYDDVFGSDGDDNFTTLFGNTVAYNADDQIKNNSNYVYDNDGNATSSPIDGTATSYIFDAEDRPTSVVNKLNMAWKGDGQRAWKQGTSGQTKEYFLYDGDTVVAEMDSNGTILHAYGYGPTGLVQRYFPSSNTTTEDYYIFSFDHLGNLAHRFEKRNSDNIPADLAVYDGMGILRYDTLTSTGQPYPPQDPIGGRGQSGTYTDEELRGVTGGTVATTGLSLAASKYYDPNTGRYLQRAGDRYFNEYEAQLLPYRVLSGLGKGFANAAVASVVDQLLPPGGVNLAVLGAPEINVRIPERFRHPFQTDGSNLERLSEATGEFTEVAFSTYLAANSVVRAAASFAEAGTSEFRTLGCFVAGTPVMVVSACDPNKVTTKPIEQIKQGDLVVSRNQQSGKTEIKRVERTSVRRVDKVETLALADAKTGQVVQTLTATANHPFYVDGKGFVQAGKLGIGNAIVTRAGPALVVKSIGWQQRPEGYLVYNFVVEDDHSYFVGTANGGAWVHNDADDCPLEDWKILYRRPHDYNKGVRDKVWAAAVNASEDGIVRDPLTEEEITEDDWEMGHLPGYEFRKHQISARRRNLTRKEFLKEYNDPSHYRPELPSSNHSHRTEAPDELDNWP